jgi:hypothetical protein
MAILTVFRIKFHRQFLNKNCPITFPAQNGDSSGVDVMITLVCDLSQFSAKKLAFFLNTNVMIKLFQNLASFWVKNAIFFAKCFGENIFKIITSVPDRIRLRIRHAQETLFYLFLLHLSSNHDGGSLVSVRRGPSGRRWRHRNRTLRPRGGGRRHLVPGDRWCGQIFCDFFDLFAVFLTFWQSKLTTIYL